MWRRWAGRFGRSLLVFGVTTALVGTAFGMSKGPVPEKRLVLEDLGFPGISQTVLAAGGSILTVHFVDADHLLVTFAERGLVPRVPGDPPDDQDRMVAGELVEITTGRVVAKTEWHLHDYGRYLWDLGEGRFLLRIKSELSTFAPLANLGDGRTFTRTSLPHRPGTVEGVIVSPDNRVLTVETSPPANKTADGVQVKAIENGDTGLKPPYTLDFYRLSGLGTPADPLMAERVGAIGSTSAIQIPLDGDGYLWPANPGKAGWTVSYTPFAGKEIPLAPVPSSCPPTLMRVGSAQLVALTCWGNSGKVVLRAYDFEKHEMWEEALATSPLPPAFAYAMEAGRFAMSRISSFDSGAQFASMGDSTASEEMRVYQTQTGDLLLKVSATPVFRTPENFDISADGRRAVVVRDGALEVYALPALSAGDKEDLAELQKTKPAVGSGRINLAGLAAAQAQASTVVLGQGSTATTVVAAQSGAVANGDSTAARKAPPSLLNPGEKAEFPEKTN